MIAAGHAKRLMVNYEYGADGKPIYLLSPAAVGWEEKTVSDKAAKHGPGRCVFLTKDLRCELHDSGFKPIQCREALTCGGKGMANEKILKLWDNPRAQALVVEWRFL